MPSADVQGGRSPGPASRAALFDLDGTLLDSVGFLRGAFQDFLASTGIDDAIDPAAFDGLPIREIVNSLLLTRGPLSSASASADAYSKAVRSAYEQHLLPFAGADEALQRLQRHGLRLGLVTSAMDFMVSPLLARIGWGRIFDVVICGNAVEHTKPAPDCYRAALALLGLPGEQVVAVEDSLNGVRAARAAGLTVIGISTSDRAPLLRAAGAVAIAAAASEVADMILSGDLRP